MDLSGKTILLVEDEAIVALMEKRLLKDEGFNVVHALDGHEAIKIVREGPPAIDLILMDIDLGKCMMDGIQAAREILKDNDIPLIFLSSHTEKEIVERTESITSYGYVVKGSCETVLLASIKMAFKLYNAYKTISESEYHFKALFENAPLGYQSLDENACFIDVNEAWLEIMGYEKEEVMGRWFGDFMTPECKEMVRERFPVFKARGKVHTEFEMIRKNGTITNVVFDGRIGHKPNGEFKQTHCILQDVTESRKMERLFLESETKYHLLFENSIDGIILISSDNRILAANPAACRISGMSEDEIKDLGRYGLCDMTDPRIPGAIEERKITGRFAGELTYLRKDGTKYPVEVTSAVFNDVNNREMFYVIFRDVTERKRYEDTMRRFTEELETSNAIKDKTLSIISHDLRGPFAGFSGLTGVLVRNLDRMSKEEIKEIANVMHNSAVETNDLLIKLLEWSKLKRGGLEFQQTELNLFAEVENIRNLYLSAASNKSICIENQTDKGTKVCTDQNVLSAILRNLVDNSIKFTPEGGRISVSSEYEGGFIKVKVTDSGIGLRKENIDKLFDLDNKITSRGTRGEKGSGLGLALCQDMLKKCGGEIKARNNADYGSEFSFTLPFKFM